MATILAGPNVGHEVGEANEFRRPLGILKFSNTISQNLSPHLQL